MYDFIKLRLYIDVEKLRDNPLLDFKREYSESTGELKNYIRAKYNDLSFYIYDSGTIRLLGSFHKFYNNGHNYDDYSIINYIETLELLKEKFEIQPEETEVVNLEFAVNIEPPVETTKILRYSFMHKGEEIKNQRVSNKGNFREAEHDYYDLKLYDKAKHYSLPQQIFRIELKYVKEVKKLGVYTLVDLINPEIIEKLGQTLAKKWNEVLFVDPTIKKENLTQKQLSKLKEWENQNYWVELNENKTYKNQFSNQVNLLRDFAQSHSDNLQSEIYDLIQKKWGELTEIPLEYILMKIGKINQNFVSDKKPKLGKINPDFVFYENSKLGKINSSYIELIFPTCRIEIPAPIKRCCKVTGLDISMQKETSEFLCTTGVKYYYENEPKTYKELEKRLSQRWKDKPLKIQFQEIAHSIRNEYFNQKNNTRRSIENIYQEKTLPLFDKAVYISEEKKKIAGLGR